MKNRNVRFDRIVLKLSGEVFDTELQSEKLLRLVELLKEIRQRNTQIAIVTGAGNIIRGKRQNLIEQKTADYIGILGSIINAFILAAFLSKINLKNKVLVPFNITSLAENYNKELALSYLDEGYILIFGGGTGHPFFTTDTAAVLRALEIQADIILKATNVDGVFDDDPKLKKDAQLLKEVKFADAINKQLKVMDLTAISLCQEHNLPVIVFNFSDPDNLLKIINGEPIGSILY